MTKDTMTTKYRVITDGKPVRFYSDARGRQIFFDEPITEFQSIGAAQDRCILYGIKKWTIEPVQRHKPDSITELAFISKPASKRI